MNDPPVSDLKPGPIRMKKAKKKFQNLKKGIQSRGRSSMDS